MYLKYLYRRYRFLRPDLWTLFCFLGNNFLNIKGIEFKFSQHLHDNTILLFTNF